MSLAQHRSTIKTFLCSQFGYCPLLWTFQSKKLNNRVNSLRERALRVVYSDYNATFSELLSNDKSVIIYQRNLQLISTEICKTKDELNPNVMEEIFKNRNNTSLKIGNLRTVCYGTKSVTNLGEKSWNLLPIKYKALKFLSILKSRISDWVIDGYPCRICKNYVYVANTGFIPSFNN